MFLFRSRYLITALLLGVVLFSFSFALWNNYWSDGDETHYLLMTQSILADKDVALSNNYANQDYLEHRGQPGIGPHAARGVDGELRSHHQFLISLVAAPGYALRGLLGARLFVWWFHLLGLALLIWTLRELGLAPVTYLLTATLFSLQLIVVTYSQYVYTDLANGYFVLAVLLGLYLHHKSRRRRWLLFSSLLAGLGVFLHVKLLVFPAVAYLAYFGYLVWVEPAASWPTKFTRFTRRSRWEIALLAGPFLLLSLVFTWMMYRWTGLFRPDAVAKITLERTLALDPDHFASYFVYTPRHVLKGFLGLWWDTENGLLYTSPFFLLAFPGTVFLYRRYPRMTLVLLGSFALLFLRQATFVKWRTWSPPARYMTVFLPSLAVAAAYYVDYLRRRWWGVAVLTGLGFWSALLSLSLFFTGKSGYPLYEGTSVYYNWALAKLGLERFAALTTTTLYEPFVNTADYLKAGWLTVLVAGWVWLTAWSSSRPKTSSEAKEDE